MPLDPTRRSFLIALGACATSSSLPFPARAYALGTQSVQSYRDEPRAIEFGADYYPEDWPADRVETDAALMEQAGFRTVRMIDTNWERLEPAEGQFSFSWLDRVLAILNRHGIRAVLGTSSYAPPAWLVAKHPEIYLVDEDGQRRRWGGMGFLCLNNPLYLEHVRRLVTALALHFGRNRGVIGWQIDNELGYWGDESYDAQYTVPKFRRYLQRRFGTLEELNRRLQTVSYGHEYTSWDQIGLRIHIHQEEDALQAPLVLEGKRFFSENLADFLTFQANILRQHTTGQFITHNGPDQSNNLFDFAKPLDFLSEDLYPLVGQCSSPAFETDLMRGFNRGQTFQVLEMRSGTYGSYTLNDATPPPGLVRLWSWQTIAHGADGVLFFRWRMNNGGSEEYWQGLLGYDGKPAHPYAEVAKMGSELKTAGPELARAISPAQVAGIVSYDSYWAVEIGHKDYPYFQQLESWATAFRRLRMNVDLIDAATDLAPYRIVFAPTLYIVDDELAERLRKFVSDGGILLTGPRAGFANVDNLARHTPPGPLDALTGVRVESFTLLADDAKIVPASVPDAAGPYKPVQINSIRAAAAGAEGTFHCGVWADILTLRGADALYTYQQDFYANRAAVTVAQTGKGKTIYVGTVAESPFYQELAEEACGLAGVTHEPPLPAAMDYALRQRGGSTYQFFLNFADVPQSVAVQGRYVDLLSKHEVSGPMEIGALDLRVLVPA